MQHNYNKMYYAHNKHDMKAVANLQITGQHPKLQILVGSFRGAALGLAVLLRGKNLLGKLPTFSFLPLPDFVFRERNNSCNQQFNEQ